MEEQNLIDHTALIAKYFQNELSEFEKNLLLEWIEESGENKKYFLQSRKVWDLTARVETDIPVNVEEAWNKVFAKLDGLGYADSLPEASGGKVVPMEKPVPWMGMAASVLLILGLCLAIYKYSWKQDMIVVSTDGHGKKEFYLPDSSKIWLKENSRLSYAAEFIGGRKVKLEGEAYFEVQKNPEKPFSITGQRSSTRVIGTSFSIKTYPGDTLDRIHVFTGKVAFQALDGDASLPVYLTKGMKAELGNDAIVHVSKYLLTNELAWKEQKLTFDNTSLEEVAKAMEEYFNIQIEFADEGLKNCRFTGTFEKPAIQEIQEVLGISANIQITKDQKLYKFSGQGCN